MSDSVIQVEKLSKRFTIGERESYATFRDAIARKLAAPFRANANGRGNGTGGRETLWALRDVSFEVKQGEVLGLLGRNGAGKSTLLKILARITRPTTGGARVRGRIGSLLEVGTGFHPELTGRENVFLSGAVLGMKKAEIQKKFDEIVAFSEVGRFLDTPLKRYSSGMQMRLAFAVAAHLEPEILLVDEVLSVGDIQFQKKCLGKMDDVAHHGRTIILVSHQMAALRHLCQRAIWLDSGQVMMDSLTHTVASAYELSLSDANPSEYSRTSMHQTRYLNWQIANRGKDDLHLLTDLDPVKIRVNLAVSNRIDNAALGIGLYDHEYKLLWSRPAEKIALESGQYAVYYTFPTIPLRPGSYLWAVAIFENGELLDSCYCEPPMTIAAQPYQPLSDEWTGILNLPSEIEIRREKLETAEHAGKSQSHLGPIEDAPKVSVVMSVYNGQAFLPEAIESILSQTFTDLEFIIIDDGSTDKTAGILSTYAKRDNRVRIFRQEENKGRAESLNWGMRLARAPLIARMDADDISLPYRLQEQVDFLNSHADIGLLGGAYHRIGLNGHPPICARPPLLDSEIRTFMLRYNAMCHSAVMMRKDVALASGGYRTALLDAEDYDLWLRMAERTQMANLDQVIVQYRVHPGQVSIQNLTQQAWCLLAARTAAAARERGCPDPLSEVKKITPQLLRDLGLTEAEIKGIVVEFCRQWIGVLDTWDPELAIRVNDNILRVSSQDSLPRTVLANLWLKAAADRYEKGRLLQALNFLGQGLLTRPIIAGRPFKRAYVRLLAVLRS